MSANEDGSCEFDDYHGNHTFGEADGVIDQESRAHAIGVVSEWMDYNSHRFTIPGGEWGLELKYAVTHVLGMAQRWMDSQGVALDPKPWVDTAPDFERYSSEEDYEGRHGVAFHPRPQYSHNREDYS